MRNEEIQKVIKMTREGVITEEQATELIEELMKKQRPEINRAASGIGDAISTLIEKTVDGAVGMTRGWSQGTSHLEGFTPSDVHDNEFHMSRVDSPKGDDYVFRGNQVRMSHMTSLTLDHSEFTDNRFDASKIVDFSVGNGKVSGCAFVASATVHFKVDSARVMASKFLSSKITQVTIKDESTLDLVKFGSCAISKLNIHGHSDWHETSLNSSKVSELTSEGATLANVEIHSSKIARVTLTNSALTGVVLQGASLYRTRIVDSKLAEVAITGGEGWSWKRNGLNDVIFENCDFSKILMSDCRWTNVVIKNVTLKDMKLEGIPLSNVTLDGNDAFLAAVKLKSAVGT